MKNDGVVHVGHKLDQLVIEVAARSSEKAAVAPTIAYGALM